MESTVLHFFVSCEECLIKKRAGAVPHCPHFLRRFKLSLIVSGKLDWKGNAIILNHIAVAQLTAAAPIHFSVDTNHS